MGAGVLERTATEAKPRPVLACEAFWARVASGDYGWTRAVAGYRAGEWHHCCPGRCGGGITFAKQADGALELRCHDGHCEEPTIIAALTGGLAK